MPLSLQIASLHEQMINRPPKSQRPPFIAIALDGGARREFFQEHPPVATVSGNAKKGIDNSPDPVSQERPRR